MRKCPFCKSPIESEDEPCIFCDGEGCKLCAGNNGKTTIVWCTSKDCILSDDEEDDEMKIGQMLTCCSKLCSNFIFGKEYKLTDISYSGSSYEFVDEEGDWAKIGSSFFMTKEKFISLTEDEIFKNDKEIEEARIEFEKFREQQWQDFLKEGE